MIELLVVFTKKAAFNHVGSQNFPKIHQNLLSAISERALREIIATIITAQRQLQLQEQHQQQQKQDNSYFSIPLPGISSGPPAVRCITSGTISVVYSSGSRLTDAVCVLDRVKRLMVMRRPLKIDEGLLRGVIGGTVVPTRSRRGFRGSRLTGEGSGEGSFEIWELMERGMEGVGGGGGGGGGGMKRGTGGKGYEASKSLWRMEREEEDADDVEDDDVESEVVDDVVAVDLRPPPPSSAAPRLSQTSVGDIDGGDGDDNDGDGGLSSDDESGQQNAEIVSPQPPQPPQPPQLKAVNFSFLTTEITTYKYTNSPSSQLNRLSSNKVIVGTDGMVQVNMTSCGGGGGGGGGGDSNSGVEEKGIRYLVFDSSFVVSGGGNVVLNERICKHDSSLPESAEKKDANAKGDLIVKVPRTHEHAEMTHNILKYTLGANTSTTPPLLTFVKISTRARVVAGNATVFDLHVALNPQFGGGVAGIVAVIAGVEGKGYDIKGTGEKERIETKPAGRAKFVLGEGIRVEIGDIPRGGKSGVMVKLPGIFNGVGDGWVNIKTKFTLRGGDEGELSRWKGYERSVEVDDSDGSWMTARVGGVGDISEARRRRIIVDELLRLG